MKIIKKISIIIFDTMLAGFALFIFYNLSWVFAHSILDGPFVGNDSPFALSLIHWYERFYPKLPLWFPQQGVGVSMYYSYPVFPAVMVIFISKLIHLDTSLVFRIVSFATFPLTALGVYLLTLTLVRSRVAAFLAGIFFLVSQASWVFLRLHGLFAQTFSMVFVPFSLTCFVQAFSEQIASQQNFLTRLKWVLGSIFLAFAILAHPVTGIVTVGGALVFAVLYILISSIVKKIKTIQGVNGILYLLIFIALGIGLSSFWFLPFSSYSKLANRDGLNTMSMSQLKEVSLLPLTLLGFHDFNTGDQRYDFFFFALPVWILFTVSIVISIFRNRKLLAAGIVAFLALIYTSAPLYMEFLIKPFKYIFTAVYFRALILPFVLIPAVAAGGLFETIYVFLGAWKDKWLKLPKGIKLITDGVVTLVVSALVILTGYYSLVYLKHDPPDAEIREHPAYGINHFDAYGPTLDKGWQDILYHPEKLLLQQPFKLGSGEIIIAPAFKESLETLKLAPFERIDVSPNALGGAILKSDALEVKEISDVSIVNLYHYYASLTHGMWGYQAGVFFGHEELYNNPILLSELTKWYGIKYAYTIKGWDRTDNYESVGYEYVGDFNNSFTVYKYPESTGIVEVSNKPAILVIGDYKAGAYEQIFRLANFGAIPYDTAYIVEGSKNLSDYKLADLKQYSGIVLHGYSYRSSQAFTILKKYLEEGGMVFINTGWQYVAKDWGDTKGQVKLADIFPVKSTVWKSFEKESLRQADINPLYIKDINSQDFADLAWRGEPWGMAVATGQDLKDGAEPIIKIGDEIVMAKKNIGKGQIIWTGFNIIVHALENQNEAEIQFMQNIISSLFGKTSQYRKVNVQIQRQFPDRAVLTLDELPQEALWLLWKESYTPNWKIRTNGNNLKLQRAGPGFVLAKLPQVLNSKKVELEYALSPMENYGAKALSILSAVFLFIYLIIGRNLNNIIDKITHQISSFINKRLVFHWKSDEAENY